VKLMVLTAAVWPSERVARAKLWIFLRSCEKFGITPHLYGCGQPFPGYIQMKLDMPIEYLSTHQAGFTHVLYTDAWDAFFTGPLDEIIEKYKALGSPAFLSSAYFGLGNESNPDKYSGCFDESLVYRYPNVGGYMGEIAVITNVFKHMDRRTGDDCFSWYDAWKEGWFRPMLDSNCEIFQVAHENTEVRDGRLYNTVTGSNPCILHISGGYMDPETGKDAEVSSWAKRVGVL